MSFILPPPIKRNLHTCLRKKAHKTFKEANKEAKRLEKKTGLPVVAYACHVCYEFHCGKLRVAA